MKFKSMGQTFDLLELNELSQYVQSDNLLVNSDFKSGIINQRAKSIYQVKNDKMYTIDMWYVSQDSQNSSVEVKEGYLKIVLCANKSFGQIIDRNLYDFADEYCITIAFKNGETKSVVVTKDNNTVVVNNNLSVSLQKWGDKQKTDFYLFNRTSQNLTLEIEFIKLEKGSTFTGMPLWDRAIETNKCQQFFQVLEYTKTIWTDIYEKHVDAIVLPVRMSRVPVADISVFDNFSVDSVEVLVVNKIKAEVSYKPNSEAGLGHRLGITIYLDAYEY